MIRSTIDSGAATFSNTSCPAHARPFMLCSAALILGAGESAITYDAMVGLNWALLVIGATVGILICSAPANARSAEQRCIPTALALLLAAALTVTTDPFWQFMIAMASIVALSVQVLSLLGHRGDALGPVALAFAPLKSAVGILHECARRAREIFGQLRADASLPIIRAVSLALPVVLILGLLLSGADPNFAAWRDAIAKAIAQISIIPRILWFAALSALTLGGLGLALQPGPAIADNPPPDSPGLRFTQADQLAVLGSAAAVFAVYLGLQVSYLFGDSGAVVGSHVTYAEAVHRGFVELNAAVTLSALVVLTLLNRSAAKPLSRLSKAAAIMLILESQILAISALHRVRLYEEAYGYTEQRLLVEVYAGAAIAVLAMLGWEIMCGLDVRRLARRTWAMGILTLCALVFWNHEAWIVRANVARYQLTGQLDADYLIYGLGPDGLPEFAHNLGSLEPSYRAELANCIRFAAATRYGAAVRYHWFEWTARREALRKLSEQYHYSARTNEQPLNRPACKTPTGP
jgi:Domain of unknown function (DUF4153)